MSRRPSQAVLLEAAQWLVRLDDQPDAELEREFAQWLALDPLHLEAVQSLRGSLAPLQALPRAPARAALNRVAHGRRSGGLKALAIALALALPLGVWWQQLPTGYLTADIRTGVGQWHEQRLPDGSHIRLDGRSAVDLQFDARSRTLRLISGEILVEVAKDAQRPFRVVTEHGIVQALGTRFVVERLDRATRLAMIESSTLVNAGGQQLTVYAGQQLIFDEHGIQPPQAVDGSELEQAWRQQQLLVSEQPLPQVLQRLGRGYSGYLLFDEKALQALKVTAVLPADDSQRALRLLARSLPIEIEHFTPWVTRVSLKQP